MNYEPGMLARSRAGHDKGSIYVIISVKNEYVYLADGALRPLKPDEKEEYQASSADPECESRKYFK